jgi:Glyoxalase/Bleomycin resistance protein/Dioxygenase superfamily
MAQSHSRAETQTLKFNGSTYPERKSHLMPDASPITGTSNPFTSWTVEHAGIRVPDFDAAVAWYTEKLDFRVTHSWPYGEMTFAIVSPPADDDFFFEVMAGPGAASRPAYGNLGDPCCRQSLCPMAQ